MPTMFVSMFAKEKLLSQFYHFLLSNRRRAREKERKTRLEEKESISLSCCFLSLFTRFDRVHIDLFECDMRWKEFFILNTHQFNTFMLDNCSFLFKKKRKNPLKKSPGSNERVTRCFFSLSLCLSAS